MKKEKKSNLCVWRQQRSGTRPAFALILLGDAKETKRKSSNGPHKQDYRPHDRINSSIEFNLDRAIPSRSHHHSLTLKRRGEREILCNFRRSLLLLSLSWSKTFIEFRLIELRNLEFCSVLVLLLLHVVCLFPFFFFFALQRYFSLFFFPEDNSRSLI